MTYHQSQCKSKYKQTHIQTVAQTSIFLCERVSLSGFCCHLVGITQSTQLSLYISIFVDQWVYSPSTISSGGGGGGGAKTPHYFSYRESQSRSKNHSTQEGNGTEGLTTSLSQGTNMELSGCKERVGW